MDKKLNLPLYPEHELTLQAMASWPATRHVFEPDHIAALRAAEASGRPLLVRGEPGTGKSQLAHAAAQAAGRLFLPFVVETRTEATDLLWHYDAVARLADAHLAAAPGAGVPAGLDASFYVQTGPLWWAFHWQGAQDQLAKASRTRAAAPELPPYDWQAGQGTVLLIDEIDKAEAEVPHGLLEALGNGRFAVPLVRDVVRRPDAMPAPLVIITTNDERELPAAFLRRCLVLTLALPQGAALADFLVTRGRLHFPVFAAQVAATQVLEQAAQMLLDDRQDAHDNGVYEPGLAEYLDLIRALQGVQGDPVKHLQQLRRFAFQKQPLR